MFAHLNPHSPDFWDICALYFPSLHQLTMQTSLFEPGHLRPCPSYSRRRDRINLGLLCSLYKGGGVLAPEQVANRVCLSIDLNTHPNNQFPVILWIKCPPCMHALLVTGPLSFPQWGGCSFGYVPHRVWGNRLLQLGLSQKG